jgi:hypothetical protein
MAAREIAGEEAKEAADEAAKEAAEEAATEAADETYKEAYDRESSRKGLPRNTDGVGARSPVRPTHWRPALLRQGLPLPLALIWSRCWLQRLRYGPGRIVAPGGRLNSSEAGLCGKSRARV